MHVIEGTNQVTRHQQVAVCEENNSESIVVIPITLSGCATFVLSRASTKKWN